MFDGKVLLTGGSGFLGRAIIRRAAAQGLSHNIIVYSRDEMKQWELKQRYPEVHCVLGDIARDLDRLIAVCSGVDTVLHLGAVKFIPEAEKNVLETIEVNIEGSKNVALAAIATGVKTVVGISTDKACAPANLYGMTKAVMERMYGEFALRSKSTQFVTARYGNVIGSTGSVIPVFKKQIEKYGEIRITHGDMTRFWFSVDEAIDLITWAWKNAENFNGHTFVSPCPAMSIMDIAGCVWDLYHCEQAFPLRHLTATGIRPGEKMHESLIGLQESPRVMKYYTVQDANELITEETPLKGFIMAPATRVSVDGSEEFEYTSNRPHRWLTTDEMKAAILDAEYV